MLLGGSICNDNGKYRGPLFARKKNRNFGKIFLVVFFMLLTISVWEVGRRYAPAVAKNVSDNVNLRTLASDFFSEDTPPKKDGKKK